MPEVEAVHTPDKDKRMVSDNPQEAIPATSVGRNELPH